MNIGEMLKERATSCPEAVAILETRNDSSRALTFAGLERASAQAAALLRGAGLRPGDAVLVFHPMSAELYIALLAIFRLGLVAMFLDPSAGTEHIDRCCALYPPRGLIASSKAHLLRFLSPALRHIPIKFAIGVPVPGAARWASSDSLAPYEQIYPCASETPALVTFTSGSTGQPKAAVRTHGFLMAQHRVLEQSLGLKPGEIDLTAMPIFVLANLASGITSLIPDADLRRPGCIDPAPLVKQIHAHRPTRAVASPALLECVADYCMEHGVTLPGLREVFSGGAPVFPRLLGKLQLIAPQAEITAVYGSTEAEPIAQIAHHAMGVEDVAAMLAGRGLLAGHPVPAIELRILRDQWGIPIGPYTRTEFPATCLPPGVAGEIVVSGIHVLPGYLHGYGDDETKFTVDGRPWHRTGDAGYLDDRGHLWLLGRCAARIEDPRGTLYPFTVECAANHHPGVRRAAAISQQGRRILAVQLEDHKASTDLTFLRRELAWASIDEIQVHNYIPVDKRHNAKIDYPALYKLVAHEKLSSAIERRIRCSLSNCNAG
jgi:acyl-CoA synthetase (AMP-forming)/AMP-acid ligase II